MSEWAPNGYRLSNMLLFEKRFHEGLVSGAVTLTFRRWTTSRVKPGGRYRCHPIGVLEVDGVTRVKARGISDAEARRSGFASRAELFDYMRRGPAGELDDDTELWRVELHHGGDGDRVDSALDDKLSADEVEELRTKLARMDAGHAWTSATLDLIEKQPHVAASKLAALLGRETARFKVDVRRLKTLGLTQSFEVGYEISPRGRAYRAAVTGAARPAKSK